MDFLVSITSYLESAGSNKLPQMQLQCMHKNKNKTVHPFASHPPLPDLGIGSAHFTPGFAPDIIQDVYGSLSWSFPRQPESARLVGSLENRGADVVG
jgi:hypothetical protein